VAHFALGIGRQQAVRLRGNGRGQALVELVERSSFHN